VLGVYRRIFDPPEARRLVAASAAARLAIGAYALPLLLAVQQATDSFATAGLAAGGFSAGVALAAPLRGRLVDRRGSRVALPAMALVSAAALGLVAILAETSPAAVLVAASAVAGAATPPLVASMRLEWQRLLGAPGDDRLAAAYAFDPGLQTALFVVGPLLAAAGIATIGARATLGASAVVLLAGSLAFAAVSGSEPQPVSEGERSPIRLPGVVTLVVATALADVSMGGVDVIVPAFAEERGRPELAGVLLALFAAGAVAGALVYGARRRPGGPATQLVVVAIAAAATCAVLAAPGDFLPLAPLLVIAGAPSAIQWAAASVALDRATGGHAGAEAFTWLSTANGIGIGVGTVVGGAAVERWGTAAAFLLSAIGPVLAAGAIAWRRGTLGQA
jgi:predicted MFS family arabinose efflux permease